MKKSGFLVLVICMAVLLTGCYHIETTDVQKYSEFYQQMNEQGHSIGRNIPKPTDTLNIEEMYLYYSDWDLVDSMYTVYVNCTYTAEEYEQAKDAAYATAIKWEAPKNDSSSFDCESIVGDQLNEISRGGTNQYCYILFDDADRRIVYVDLFEDALKRTSKNIPQEYLPKELRDTHNR